MLFTASTSVRHAVITLQAPAVSQSVSQSVSRSVTQSRRSCCSPRQPLRPPRRHHAASANSQSI
eukprot:1276999-Pyramimonas_sp.AAC.1